MVNTLNVLGRGAAKVVYEDPSNSTQALAVANLGSKISQFVRRLLGKSTEDLLRKETADLGSLKEAIPLSHQPYLALDNKELSEEEKPATLKGRLVVASPKAEGDLEKNLLNSPQWTLAERVRLCRDAVMGVAGLHAAEKVHGDLKPENFLVYTDENGSPTAKLADFGLTQSLPAEQALCYTSGNEAFKAPDSALTKKAEIFSMGLVCTRILEEAILGPDATTLVKPDTTIFSSMQKKRQRGVVQYLISDNKINRFSSNHIFAWITRKVKYLAMKLFGKSSSEISSSQKQEEEKLHHYINVLGANLKDKHPGNDKEIDDMIAFVKQMTSFDPDKRPDDATMATQFETFAEQLDEGRVEFIEGTPEEDDLVSIPDDDAPDYRLDDVTSVVSDDSVPTSSRMSYVVQAVRTVASYAFLVPTLISCFV